MTDLSAARKLASGLIETLTARELTLAVAESLTGGLVVAELVAIPGASAVLFGGVVAYNTELKHSVLGVAAELLGRKGAVDPEVAAQMAKGVRDVLAVSGRVADIGISTTGVAGPDWQDGHPPGTVFIGISIGDQTDTIALSLDGDRQAIREAVVYELLTRLAKRLETF